MDAREEIRDYPFLTPDEFNLACHYLDQKYIAAPLRRQRQIFKMHVNRSQLTGESFVAIKLPIDTRKDEPDVGLSAAFEALRWNSQGNSGDVHMDMEAEEADFEALRRMPTELAPPDFGLPVYGEELSEAFVGYEIHLHSTYRTPVLWFSMYNLPLYDSCFDIEMVYRYLVPDQFKSGLRTIGVMGGISAGNHPLTDLPAFFIHPCSTKEAMEPFSCSLKDYLMIWLGLVGPSVGLWLPSAMAQVGS